MPTPAKRGVARKAAVATKKAPAAEKAAVVSRKAPAARKVTAEAAGKDERWSQEVTETSDAMDLKPDVFKGHDPKAIARSLKSSAEHSDRRKSSPYRSAISMLTFYINRAGDNLDDAQRKRLEAAKDELRVLFGREPAKKPAAKKGA